MFMRLGRERLHTALGLDQLPCLHEAGETARPAQILSPRGVECSRRVRGLPPVASHAGRRLCTLARDRHSEKKIGIPPPQASKRSWRGLTAEHPTSARAASTSISARS